MLKIKNLSAGYADVPILHEVNVVVNDAAIVSVVGPNGAGKSTLLKAIYGIARVTGGNVTLSIGGVETEITGLKTYQLADKGIGYVPQIDNIFPALTIEENLDVGAARHAHGAELAKEFDAIYTRYPDLGSRRKERAGALSGGQRQTLALARALMSKPQVLLLDEPSAGLAPALVDQLFDELVAINSSGISILMVEQNARRSLEISTYGYVLDMGRNRYEGTGQDLAQNPAIVGIYFGRHTPTAS